MVLDLPGGLFKQTDVRETSGVESTPKIGDFTDSQHTHADATGGGLTTHKSGNGADHANVVLNDTHRTSNGTNHANVVTNTSGISTNVTAIGLNTTHRGSAGGTDHSDVSSNNTHRGSNGSDHSLIANKTSYWSAAGIAVQGPGTIEAQTGSYLDVADANEAYLPVNLPQGAVVTRVEAIGLGNTPVVWTLYRKTGSGLGNTMASAGLGLGPDVSISNATIANQTYSYYIRFLSMDGRIDRVEIQYTTDYI